MEEKEMGELLVCLAFTSDDRKWKWRLAAVICAALWGHICVNSSQALASPRRCHSKAFYVFSLWVFSRGFGVSVTGLPSVLKFSWLGELLTKLLLMPSL